MKDDWQKQFEAWKSKVKKRKTIPQKEDFSKIKKDIQDALEKLNKQEEKAEKKTINYLKEPKHIIILKVLCIFIPLIILQYLIYSNFLVSQDFVYFYDIGSEKDNSLLPTARISDKIIEPDINYRNLTDQLVYFNVPITRNSENIKVEIKFKDNFPENSKFSLGAKDQEEWHYTYNSLYTSMTEKLMQKYPYEIKNNLILFKLNPLTENYSIEQFLTNPPSARFATNQDIPIQEFKIQDYAPNNFEINSALRGTLIFYVYVKDALEIEVEKRDLNWYDEDEKGEDKLYINLYDLNNNLIASETIKDDGENSKKPNKDNKGEDKGELFVPDLREGVYKLELKNNGDMLITNLKLNQNKIVLYKEFFPAQSSAYFNDFEKKTKVYFKVLRNAELTAQTWHNYAVNQTIKIDSQKLKIKEISTPESISLNSSDEFHELISEINDVVIKGPEFFAFSQDSWFDPFQGKINFKEDIAYLEKNADYVLVDYLSIKDSGNRWKIAETSFELNNLFIKDNKLSLMFNAPHLSQNKQETNKMYISIDWIKVSVHKPGLIEKYKENREQTQND